MNDIPCDTVDAFADLDAARRQSELGGDFNYG